MKKRIIQILLALSLIFYKSTWFWRVFNHFAKPYLPASRDFFQILLLMESGVTAEIPIETFGSVIGTHLGEGSIALSYTPIV